jgi:hypothetical protein
MDQTNFTSYSSHVRGDYKFLVDTSMELERELKLTVVDELYKILESNNSNENAKIKNYVINAIDWVVDAGIHVGLCIHEINCIVIMKGEVQYKFIKLFTKNIDELISDGFEEDKDLIRQLK